MKTRTQQRTPEHESSYVEDDISLELENFSDEELDALLFEEEPEKSSGLFNLPTVAGLSLIVVGIVYMLQELGFGIGINLGAIVGLLPWLAGILIILLGFGVLSWRPKKKKKEIKVKERVRTASGKEKVVVEAKKQDRDKRKLTRSRNKKIAGVSGGIAEYFGVDPTLVRIAFVIATIATGGNFIFAYLILAFIMPKPEPRTLGDLSKSRPSDELRVTITRDS